MLRKSAISLAIMGALVSMQANALGLGEVKVSSALNQPLQAEIDLLQLRGLNASQVVTRLANTDDFYLAGVRPSPILSDIRFKLDITGGQGKIVLTTSAPIREPFLNFLIEVNWPSGRLVREYTVLLDPPVFTAEDLAPRGQPLAPVVKPAASAQSKRSTGKPKDSTSTAATASRVMSMSSEYRVTKADTLWQIALKVRPDASISPQQMMLAIQRANPDAFIKNNINRLKSGVVLDIPSKEQILNINAQESLQEVKRQNTKWRGAPATADKSKTAKLDVAKEELDASSAAVVTDSQLRIVSKVAEETPTSPVEPGVVASETSTTASEQPLAAEISAKNEELEEQLVVTLEGLNKVERDNVEMFDRLDRLSEQMASMQRLVELKDQQLAELQGQLAQKQSDPVVPKAEEPSITSLPFEWIAAAGAALLALLAGLLMFMRKRKQEEDVDSALEQLNEREAVVDLPQGAESPLEVAAAAVTTAAVLDAVDDATTDNIVTEDDSNDPFNMSTESRGPLDEFDSISDDELDSALGEDLDMDLKLDEPVIDDPEMSEFSNSLLDDDEYDLSTGFDDDQEAEVSAATDADSDLDTDLDSLLAENGVDDSGVDSEITEMASVDEGADIDEDFDGDLDALLAESGFADAEAEKSAEPAAGLDDDLEEGFGSDLDELLSEEDGLSSDLDDLLSEDDGLSSDLDDLLADGGSADTLLAEEDSIDETLEQMLEEHDKNAESSGIEQVTIAVDEDIPDDETLDALLNNAVDLESSTPEQASEEEEIDQGIDIEFDPIDDLDEDLQRSENEQIPAAGSVVDELPDQVLDIGAAEEELSEFALDTEQDLIEDLDLDDVVSSDDLESAGMQNDADKPEKSDDGFVFELDDATDDKLDFSVEGRDAETKTTQRSSLSLEDDLDQADDAELEAELEQMLVSENNDLALQETDLDDDEVNYLDGADEIGTKIDLARAYIDMEDPEGARDILQEVIDEGSSEQVAEAKQLLESLNS